MVGWPVAKPIGAGWEPGGRRVRADSHTASGRQSNLAARVGSEVISTVCGRRLRSLGG